MNIKLLLLIFSSPSLLFAQHSLSGTITHIENGEPVIGAAIYLPDLRIGTVTDVQGFYKINNIPRGSLMVEIKYVSHKTIVEKITIDGTVTKDFTMENSAISMDEVIVSGNTTKTLIKESPIPILTMSNIQWLQSGSTNLIDAVAKLPGMSQIQTGPALSKPIIRGLGFNRVITMHDGIRQEDNQWGEEHSIQIDEYSIDKYEIIRGAGSLMYGSDGLGGVMSVLSQRPAEESQIKAGLLSTYQSNSNLYGLSAMASGNHRGLVWMLRTSHKNSDNYRNAYDGRVYGSNFNEQFNINGMMGLQKKWGYSRIYFARWNQQINIIDGTRDATGRFTRLTRTGDTTAAYVTIPDQDLSTRQINSANSQDLSNYKISVNNYFALAKNSGVTLNIGYSQNHRKEYGNVFTPGVPDLYFYLQTFFYDGRYTLPEIKGIEITLGTNGMYQAMKNRGNETLYPDFQLFDNGIFLFAKKKLNRFTISGGIRHDIRQLDIDKLYIDVNGKFQTSAQNAVSERFAGFNRQYRNITGSIGAVYLIHEKVSLKANIARGFRAPAVSEISSNGVHVGTYRYEVGNLQQQSEISWQADAGATYDNKNFYADVNLFQNNIQNYTYSERIQSANGQDTLIEGVKGFRYTQGHAQLLGLEVMATINPEKLKWLSFTQTYSIVRGQNMTAKNDSAKFLPFMPPPRWISRIKVTRDTWGNWLRNAYAFVELEYNQPQDQVLLAYQTETITPGYTLLHAGMGADVTSKQKKTLFSLYITANNILDLAYQSHQSRLKYLDQNQASGRYGVFNMGRNISVRLLIPITASLPRSVDKSE